MKPLLALVAGFVVSLGMFVFGLVFATSLLTAAPVHQPGPSVDVAGLWTEQPRTVDTASQHLERIAALPAERGAEASEPAQPAPADTEAPTGPGTDDGREQPMATAEMSAAHVEWCSRRYRSYRVRDNSYAPYGGGRRPCVSPYFEEVEAAAESAADSVIHAESAGDALSEPLEYASADQLGSGFATSEHAAYCFSRYRSYRPDDNTYQPYGGGPRRQCR